VSRFIDAHRERFGVEPICQALAVVPSTYYAARTRPPSARACRDALRRRNPFEPWTYDDRPQLASHPPSTVIACPVM